MPRDRRRVLTLAAAEHAPADPVVEVEDPSTEMLGALTPPNAWWMNAL